jgi:hypothetical protein
MLGDEFLKDRLNLGQVVSGARKMVMRAGDGNWHHALCRADIDEGFIILPRKFGGDRLACSLIAARNPRNRSGSA